MTARTKLKGLLDKGTAAGGLFVSIPSPVLIDIAAVAGFDFALIDLEHTLIGGEAIEHMIAAADRAGLSIIVRVPDCRSERIVQVLDAGAAGIVVPRCRTAEDAEAAVQRARYGPAGGRGLNAGRLGRFGDCDLAALIQTLDRQTLVIAMIEDEDGLVRVADIAGVKGVDGLLFGAADYSQSIDQPWQTGSPAVLAAEQRLAEAVAGAGKHLFVIPRKAEDIARYAKAGASGIIAANDRGLLRAALSAKNQEWRAVVQALRNTTPEPAL